MARARMLSASISESGKFAALSCDSARLLYLMLIPHADNLGRMRGEPLHVLATVVPRTGAKMEQVDQWLGELARVGLIKWYIHQDRRFIFIMDWTKHQTLHHTAKKCSDLPDPEDGENYLHREVTVSSPLAHREGAEFSPHEVEGEGEGELASSSKKQASPAVSHHQTSPSRESVRGSVIALAEHLNAKPRRAPAFPNTAAWTWITQELRSAKPKDSMALMAWLWKDGVHDLETCKRMVSEALTKRIRDPYAYFAKTGDARTCRADQVAMDHVEAEHQRQKAEERAWLS